MNKNTKKNITKKYISPLCFLLFGIGALCWFINSLYNLLTGLDKSFVLINQGAYYALGGSIGLLSLSSLLILDQWIKKSVRNYWAILIQKIFLFGFILFFTLPHVIDYFASNYLVENGYSVCEAASRNWLYIHKTVYIHPPQECYKTLVYP